MLFGLFTKASNLAIAKKQPRSLLERIRDVNGPPKEEKTFEDEMKDFKQRMKKTISQYATKLPKLHCKPAFLCM